MGNNVITDLTLEGAVDLINKQLAHPYQYTSAYKVGEFVTHDGGLYKCISAVSENTIFNPTNWERVALADCNRIDDSEASASTTYSSNKVESIANTKVNRSAYESDLAKQVAIANGTYEGEDLEILFADEIANYSSVWAWVTAREAACDFSGINVGDYVRVDCGSHGVYRAIIMGINVAMCPPDGENPKYTYFGNNIDWRFSCTWDEQHCINKANYNNGVVPFETIITDGATTEYTLTKPMLEITAIKNGDTSISETYTYDPDTYKITFATAPAAATLTVIGNGSEFPWIASDMYHWLNSKQGIVANSTFANPDIVRVDYTESGVWYNLPTELKDAIIPKCGYYAKRYDKAELLTDDNGVEYVEGGNIWLLSENELFGQIVKSNPKYNNSGAAMQYKDFSDHEYNKLLKYDQYTYYTYTEPWYLLNSDQKNSQNFVCMNQKKASDSVPASTLCSIVPCFRTGTYRNYIIHWGALISTTGSFGIRFINRCTQKRDYYTGTSYGFIRSDNGFINMNTPYNIVCNVLRYENIDGINIKQNAKTVTDNLSFFYTPVSIQNTANGIWIRAYAITIDNKGNEIVFYSLPFFMPSMTPVLSLKVSSNNQIQMSAKRDIPYKHTGGNGAPSDFIIDSAGILISTNNYVPSTATIEEANATMILSNAENLTNEVDSSTRHKKTFSATATDVGYGVWARGYIVMHDSLDSSKVATVYTDAQFIRAIDIPPII